MPSDPIHITQRSFLCNLIRDKFIDINYTDLWIASDGLPRNQYKNILRLYYNRFYDECYAEIVQLIQRNAHKISTEKSQFIREFGEDPNNFS